MGGIKSVLFVCTGNSCRSVMAEALLKKYLLMSGKGSIKVSSAGSRAINGMSPTEETIEVLDREGIKLSDPKSMALSEPMIKESDLILVMEDIHKSEVLKMVPGAANKTYLLKEYKRQTLMNPEEGLGVPDPIGRPIEFYKYVLNTIKKETERIAKLL